MAILDVKCTTCGAEMKVDGGLDAAVCEFCGAAFVVEKAVRNFYVGMQAGVAPAAPQAPAGKTKNYAKIALACGICATAIAPVFGLVAGFIMVDQCMYSYDRIPVYAFLAFLGLIGMALGIVGIVASAVARREPAARNTVLTAAGRTCSVLGLVLTSIMTLIYLLAFLGELL